MNKTDDWRALMLRLAVNGRLWVGGVFLVFLPHFSSLVLVVVETQWMERMDYLFFLGLSIVEHRIPCSSVYVVFNAMIVYFVFLFVFICKTATESYFSEARKKKYYALFFSSDFMISFNFYLLLSCIKGKCSVNNSDLATFSSSLSAPPPPNRKRVSFMSGFSSFS